MQVHIDLTPDRINRLIRENYDRNATATTGARAALLKSSRSAGGQQYFLIHPSTKTPDRWQLTWCDKDMVPFGDTVFASFDHALRSACGLFAEGPPYGDRSYAVIEVFD